jgi:iron(III) transport system permease protein
VALALPLGVMLAKSVQDGRGAFVGLANYLQYFKTPALAYSIYKSFLVAVVSTVITVPLAFVYAYALTRSCRSRACSRPSRWCPSWSRRCCRASP